MIIIISFLEKDVFACKKKEALASNNITRVDMP